MAYRRGFKTEANDLACEVRTELRLEPFDRLDPWRLAEHLEIPIVGLSELASAAPAIKHLMMVEPEAFSAVTVFRGAARTIVHNDGHAPVRQNSNLAHELAHGLLLHPPTPALDDRGCRNWNQDVEDEAGWLGGILLITEEMTIAIARGQLNAEEAARRLGVSRQMLRFRMNATGAAERVRRAHASAHNGRTRRRT
jgi:Zn-dependent peptidase ImmA (M78 family)